MTTQTTNPAPIHLAQASGPAQVNHHLLHNGSMVSTCCGMQTNPRYGRVTCFAADATCRYCLPRPKTYPSFDRQGRPIRVTVPERES